jgi:hypothetical protein
MSKKLIYDRDRLKAVNSMHKVSVLSVRHSLPEEKDELRHDLEISEPKLGLLVMKRRT